MWRPLHPEQGRAAPKVWPPRPNPKYLHRQTPRSPLTREASTRLPRPRPMPPPAQPPARRNGNSSQTPDAVMRPADERTRSPENQHNMNRQGCSHAVLLPDKPCAQARRHRDRQQVLLRGSISNTKDPQPPFHKNRLTILAATVNKLTIKDPKELGRPQPHHRARVTPPGAVARRPAWCHRRGRDTY